MQITSATTDTAKKSRAKKDAVVAAAPVAKKPRARKKASSEPAVQQVEKSSASTPVLATSTDNLAEKIAVAAYFIAAQRNFAAGRELDDWLAAEQMVLSHQAA
jgi:hypothetical protein